MQESMVKFVLALIALLALAVGGVFLIIPGWFVTFAGIENAQLAWTRGVGAAVVTVQGFGLFMVAFRRRDTNPTLGLISLGTTVETGFLWYSLIVGEFAEQALWTVIVPGIAATAAVLVLWVSWVSRRKSRATIGGPSARIAQDEQPGAGSLDEAIAQAPPYEPGTSQSGGSPLS